jgi:hypothetical protein
MMCLYVNGKFFTRLSSIVVDVKHVYVVGNTTLAACSTWNSKKIYITLQQNASCASGKNECSKIRCKEYCAVNCLCCNFVSSIDIKGKSTGQ